MKTKVVNTAEIKRCWYLFDASEAPLGRLASIVATVLSGKRKPAFSPNQDHGDNVVVINADNLMLTGRKMEFKTYFRHSRYPGGEKVRTLAEQMKRDSTQIIRHAIHGMLPKNTLGRAVLKKLHVYRGATHRHEAQKPEKISLKP